MNTTENNKAIVRRFNKEFIEEGNMDSFKQLVADDVHNHAAPTGAPAGPESFIYFLNHVLRAGFPDIRVEILEQVAEGDLVTSRKVITGTHMGEMLGIAPTHKKVEIKVIDIIRLRDGKYVEHWGQSNFGDVIRELSAANAE